MTGNGTRHQAIPTQAAAATGERNGPSALPVSRAEFVGILKTQDISLVLGRDSERERCVETGLEILGQAAHAPARTVVTLGPGRLASLDFYVDADCDTCSQLDGRLQDELATRCTSVLPPGLSLGIRPLAAYAQDTVRGGESDIATRFKSCARELLFRGGEINLRMSAVCAYLSALYETREATDSLGYLDQSLLEGEQETLSWRLRRHRSVEGRALAQRLERLSRDADDALYEFGTRFSFERASYQLEQLRCFHAQLGRFGKACRPDSEDWPDLISRGAYSGTLR